MTLSVGGENYTIGSSETFVMGRGANCNLVLTDANMVSRVHAKIVFKRGKFVLIDRSTNGTYVKTGSGDTMYLRREEIHLWGRGEICLGSDFEDDAERFIHYNI